MVLPEELQQFTIAGLVGVVFYLNRLCVVAEAVVARPLLPPAREPDPGAKNPLGTAELRLGEPKSAESEGCGLVGSRFGVVLAL